MTSRRLFMDIGPLRESPAFRRLWIGSAVSAMGSRMTGFAVILQVFTLTGSSAAVGAVGLAIAVPMVGLGLLGGAVVDAFDRRRLVLITTTGMAAISAVFAAQAFAGNRHVWPLYCLVTANSLLSAVSGPARRTFLPRLLPAERIPAGAALNTLVFHGSSSVGPALAGVLAAAGGLKLCYLVDTVSFAAAFYGVARLPTMLPEGGAVRPGARAVGEGLRFIRNNRVLGGALLADMNATVLGMPIALFPAINADRFGGAAQTLGLLTAAPAVGGIVGSALSGSVGHVSRQGRAMLVAGAAWGAGLAAFGLADSLWLALVLLVLAGTADVIAVVFRTAMVQVTTPDRLRGRVSAAESIVGAGCPQLGNFRAGAVGSLTSPTISAVSGGLATIAGTVLIGLSVPAFVRYGARPEPVADSVDQPEPVGPPGQTPAPG